MIDEFESVTLSCGHVINSYRGFGVCRRCGRKACGQCLQLVDDDLLCPGCFVKKLGE